MASFHPNIVEDILAMAMNSATPLEKVRLASVNKYTRSFLSPEVRKRAIMDKIKETIKKANCQNNSVKLLQGVTIAFTITLTDKKVRVMGNLIFEGTFRIIECSRTSMTKLDDMLEDIITAAKYTKVRVNKKDVHTDTVKLATLFEAAKI